MPSAHQYHRKAVEPYTLAVRDLEKRVPSFSKKLEAYPTVRKHLFPQAEGERAFRQLSSITTSFEKGIPNVVKTIKHLSMQGEAYLRMLTQEHLSISEYTRLVSEEAGKMIAQGVISGVLLAEVQSALAVASDEVLLAARRAPSASLVPVDVFAFFGIETAELRSDLRKLRATIELVDRAYGQDTVHEALCPNCLMKAACEAANLN